MSCADPSYMSWLDLRPAAPSVPARAARVVRDHVKVRLALLVAAWVLLALRFFEWHAFLFQAAIAGVVLWHALHRERVLREIDGKRVQLELVTSLAAATERADGVSDLLAGAVHEIGRQSGWPRGRAWTAAELHESELARRAAETRGPVVAEAGFAFPVLADGDVVAVLEFSSPAPRRIDDALRDALPHLATQLGQFVKRTRAEEQSRAADARLRSLVETLPLATYVDRPGEATGTVWVSPQMKEITSYDAHEWVDDPHLFRKVLHPDDRDRVVDAMVRVRETGEALDHEYRMIRRDGSIVWIHDSAISEWRDGVHLSRGFIVDVTARREAESERDASLEQLREQNEQLRQLDSLKDEFVALVSHELRTPLTSIRGYLELMREDANLTDEQTRFLETIDRNAVRLQRVVGDLLFCAQVEAGKLSLDREPLDLNALLEDAIANAAPAAQARAVELQSDLTAFAELLGDRARLAQVVDNLVSNAIKFTPAGGRVRVASAGRDGEVEITIADTGMGIAAHELPRLFQRFFRTERATAQAIPGTGLGLAIANAIVEGHGGRIDVESVEGAGTAFRVRLPVAVARAAGEGGYASSPASAQTTTATHGTPITSV
jgi:PAS domain S-box-containing protein